MAFEIIVFVLGAVLLFELVEHVVLPIAAAVAARKRPAVTGAEGMVGKKAVVKRWRGSEGQVVVDGEPWTATSEHALAPGETVDIRRVQGLTLLVERTATEG
jgi:membrane-bound serine protease (ClpP class)